MQTDWMPFGRDDLGVPADLLQRISTKSGDTWVSVEPEAEVVERRFGRSKEVRSEMNATLSPFADDAEPHVLYYVEFVKGPPLTERGIDLPAWLTVDDDGRDSAMLRAPLATNPADVVQAAMAILDGAGGGPLGDRWRCCIGDTYSLLDSM